MAGGIVFVVVMVIAVPMGVMLVGAIWSATFGWLSSMERDQEVGAAERVEPTGG